MSPADINSPKYFMQGFLFYLELCASSKVKEVRESVGEKLAWARQVWCYRDFVSEDTIKYMKHFITTM